MRDDDNDSSDSGASTTSGEKSTAIVSNPDNAKVKLTIGSKNFTEQNVLGETYAQGLEAAGYKINKHLNLGNQNIALNALKRGQESTPIPSTRARRSRRSSTSRSRTRPRIRRRPTTTGEAPAAEEEA